MSEEDGLRRLPSLHHQDPTANSNPNPNPPKRKRSLPGTPDPDAEVIAMSPKSLMATNRFMCEICNKGFQRDQNLQLHRRGHNLPWKLKQRSKEAVRKKVYICPEPTCIHHDPTRALGDLTGIKKHYSRKHGEKKWKCEKCAKKYAVQSDWKAHAKICGTREYKCDCGTLFSRKDSFITHRAFCDALAEESARFTPLTANTTASLFPGMFTSSNTMAMELQKAARLPMWLDNNNNNNNNNSALPPNSFLPTTLPELVAMTSQGQWFNGGNIITSSSSATAAAAAAAGGTTSSAMLRAVLKEEHENKAGNLSQSPSLYYNDDDNNPSAVAAMSATALLQKATQIGSTTPNSTPVFSPGFGFGFGFPTFSIPFSHNDQEFLIGDNVVSTKLQRQETTPGNHHSSLTRDFLGVGSRPFLEEHDELAKFASSMSHYSGNL